MKLILFSVLAFSMIGLIIPSVSAEIYVHESDFPFSINPKSIKLRKGGKEISFLFIPQRNYKGLLYWILAGKTMSMTKKLIRWNFRTEIGVMKCWGTSP